MNVVARTIAACRTCPPDGGSVVHPPSRRIAAARARLAVRRHRAGAVRGLLATAMLAGALHPAHAATVYYLDLVNASPSAVVAFDVAPAGSGRFHSVLSGHAPLHGDGAAATVAIRKGDSGCLRDLRVRFADGRLRTHRYFDVCRFPLLAFDL